MTACRRVRRYAAWAQNVGCTGRSGDAAEETLRSSALLRESGEFGRGTERHVRRLFSDLIRRICTYFIQPVKQRLTIGSRYSFWGHTSMSGDFDSGSIRLREVRTMREQSSRRRGFYQQPVKISAHLYN